MKKFKGFTLAETMVTLAILGVVAAITVPAIMRHQASSANRVKIKKALAVYDSAVNQMIIENRLHSTSELNDFVKNDENCSNAYKYFKTIVKDRCQFMTADKLWWDVGTKGTMSKSIVAFKKADLTTANANEDTNNKAFYFITKYDSWSFKTNDMGNAYENGDLESVLTVSKILAYLNNQNIRDFYRICQNNVKRLCFVFNANGLTVNFYDKDGVQIQQSGCTNGTSCKQSMIVNPTIYFNEGHYAKYGQNCDAYGNNCTNSEFQFYPNSNASGYQDDMNIIKAEIGADSTINTYRRIYNCSNVNAFDYNDSSCTLNSYYVTYKDEQGNLKSKYINQ